MKIGEKNARATSLTSTCTCDAKSQAFVRTAEGDGGAEGIRTPDPHNAIVVLYQLSYDPHLMNEIEHYGFTPKVSTLNLQFFTSQRFLAWKTKNPYNNGVSSNPLIEIRQLRLQKAASARALGLNPYPSRAKRTHYAKKILDDFESLKGTTVTVAGRLVSWRKQGALAFGHVQDQSGRIQLFCRRQLVQPTDPATGILGYSEANLLDLGDIVEATGEVMKTERGEISVLVHSLRLLTKAIRPLPDQWSGLKDREQVLRKRYLDTILEPSSFERFGAVSRMVAAMRTFLNGRGFMEFQTPVIQPQYGGGTAKPFKTHVNALGCEMYLAISHELYLKRLIVAGFDKVYTIGRYFRNEGIDRSHHPEFSMVETMAAYENYEYNMNLVEDMFRHVAVSAFGRTEFKVRGHTIDFNQPWRRVSMADAVKEKTGVDFRACRTAEEANAKLSGLGINEPQPSAGEAMVKAFECDRGADADPADAGVRASGGDFAAGQADGGGPALRGAVRDFHRRNGVRGQLVGTERPGSFAENLPEGLSRGGAGHGEISHHGL